MNNKYYKITVTTTDSGSCDDLQEQQHYHPPIAGVMHNADNKNKNGDNLNGFFDESPFFSNPDNGENNILLLEAPPPPRRARPSHPWKDFCFPASSTHTPYNNFSPAAAMLPLSSRLYDACHPNHLHCIPSSHRDYSSSSATLTKSQTIAAATVAKKKTRTTSRGIPPVVLVPTPTPTTTMRDEQGRIESLGPSHLQIYIVTLPKHLRNPQTFRRVTAACEEYARTQPRQWETNLYSLTKQDIAIADISGGPELVSGIQDYVVDTIRRLYRQPSVLMDRNQPHILKYNCGGSSVDTSTNHCSVPLHHDRCHVTVNLMMSQSVDYTGGGTFLVDLNQRVMLQQGQFLLHPGHLVHGGCEITRGSRYLMVFFVHFPTPLTPSRYS